jgi:hypothetical protein
MPTIKPIETRYAGCRFRSRLEARWAVFFDEEHIKWRYEPEGFDLGQHGFYLPDFWLPELHVWAEVKPFNPSVVEVGRMAELAESSGHPVLALIDQPAYCAYWGIHGWSHPDAADNGYWDECLSCVGKIPDDWGLWEVQVCDYTLTWRPGRLYANSGVSGKQFPYPVPLGDEWGNSTAGIVAARSARFEHGECGSR